jgi:hypothetical protein
MAHLIVILQIRLILVQSHLSLALKVVKLETSHVYHVDTVNFTAGLQEQLDSQPFLLGDIRMVPVVIGENLKRGSRVIIVKGVAWKT